MEHADKHPSLRHHPRPEAERAAAYEAGAAWGAPGSDALAWRGILEHSPHLARERAWVAGVYTSPHSVAQRQRIDDLIRAPDPARAPPGGTLQAKIKLSTVGRVGLGILKGLLNAVAPFFAGYDYAANLHAIHKDRSGEGVLYGKGKGLAVLAGVKETTQLVATLATAAGILFGIISAFMPPVAAAATIAGVVATVAHAVTLVLRAVSTGALAVRLRQVESSDLLRRGAIKAQIYQEIGGMVGNGLGVLFGGLGGGFTPTAASNPLSSMASQASATSGGQAAAYLGVGQVGNSLADTAGGIAAARARGTEHRAERAAEQQLEVELGHVPTQEDEEIDEQPLTDAVGVLTHLGHDANQDQVESARTQGELQEQVSALDEGRGALQEVVQQIEPVENISATLQGLEHGALEGSSEEHVAPLHSALQEVRQVMPEVVEPEREEHETEEQKVDEEVVDEGGYLADDEREDTTQRRVHEPLRQRLAAREWKKPVRGIVLQANGEKKPGLVKRIVKTVKSKGQAWLARALGLGRKIRKAFAKLKAKFMAAVLRMLGLKEPAVQAQAEVAEERALIPSAIASQQRLAISSAGVAKQAPELAAGIRKALSGGPAP